MACNDDPVDVELSAPSGRKFVQVSLSDHDTVCFNANYLVGFSSLIRLSTTIEFSWCSFGMHRNFIQKAKGPGTLIFEVNGEPSMALEGGRTFSPSRLIAWSHDVLFDFCGMGSVIDIYANDILVEARASRADAVVLLDADSETAGRMHGAKHIVQFLKRVYLPL